MAYKEDEYLMLSGIQHFKFCRRQWALIHIEQQWSENVHTVIGELMHKKVHDPSVKEKRKETLLVRALPVSSKELGVSGECNLVEFHKCEDGITLSGHRGLYSVFPVEYKKGKPKITDEDKLQLTAQAMCLEEMFSATVSAGALFYGETRRREVVEFTDDLRNEVRDMFEEMHLADIMPCGYRHDPTEVSSAEVLDMATVNGARLQGRSDTGVLAVGKKADIIALDLDKPHLYPNFDTPALLTCAAHSSDVVLTMVDGKILYENGEYKTLDREKVFYEARAVVKRLYA